MKAAAIVAILLLGLLVGLLHHHRSSADSDACSYCHAGVQTPGANLASALVATSFAVVGLAAPIQTAHPFEIGYFSTLIPRAPPVTTQPVMFREGCPGWVRA